MSVHQGSFSLTRYRLIGGAGSFKYKQLNEELGRYQARPIRLKGVHKPTHYGWVRPQGPVDDNLPTEEQWDMADCRVGDGYLLRIRVEKRKIPAQLLNIVFKKRLQQRLKGRKEPLGRKDRQELLEGVKGELLDQCLPAISYVEAFWDEPKREVVVFTTARSSLTIFEELFRKTFSDHLGLAMVRIMPPLQGLTHEEWQGEMPKGRLEKMNHTIPSSFAYQNV